MKFFVKIGFVFIAFLLFSPVYASVGIPSSVFPAPISVYDETGVLEFDHKKEILDVIEGLKLVHKFELAVVVIESLKGYPIEDFALQLGRYWGVGDKDLNSGIVVLVSLNDRQSRIEVGYGVEGVLTDAESSWILEDANKFFKNGAYSEGLLYVVSQINNVINQNPIERIENSSKKDGFLTLLIILMILYLYYKYSKNKKHFRSNNKSNSSWWDGFGGGSGGGSSGGFGGSSGNSFGGGSFGGGGASSRW